MPTRGIRGGEKVSSPVVGGDGVKGPGIGPNGPCSPSTGDGGREDEVVIIVRSAKSDKGSPGALFEGVGGEIGALKSTGVVHDGVQGVGGGKGEMTIESDELCRIDKGAGEIPVQYGETGWNLWGSQKDVRERR